MQKSKRGGASRSKQLKSAPILPVVAPEASPASVVNMESGKGGFVPGYVRGRADEGRKSRNRAPSPKDQQSKLAREYELEGRRCMSMGSILRLVLLFAIVFNIGYYLMNCVGGNCSLSNLSGPLFTKEDVVEAWDHDVKDTESDEFPAPPPAAPEAAKVAPPPAPKAAPPPPPKAAPPPPPKAESGSYRTPLTDAQQNAAPKLGVKPQKPFAIPKDEPKIEVDDTEKEHFVSEDWDRKDMKQVAKRVLALEKLSKLWYQAVAFEQQGGSPSKMTKDEWADTKTFVGDAERAMYPFMPPNFDSLGHWKYSIDKTGGRGIVLVIVAPQQVKPVIGMLKSLRQALGCKLPVQIFHDGRGAIDGDSVAQLEGVEGVEVKSILTFLPPDRIDQITQQMYLKVFAIMFSKYREVISIEADVFFLQNPEAGIFSYPEYEKHGALFFNDRFELNPHSEKQADWLKEFLTTSKALEENRYFKGSANYQLDHGVVAIDKSKHFWGLLGVASISWGASRETFTSLILEKEALWVGFEMAKDSDYAFEKHPVGAIGNLVQMDADPFDAVQALTNAGSKDFAEIHRPDEYDNKPGKENGKICGPHSFHADYSGERALWINSGLSMNPWDPNAPFTGLESWTMEVPGRWDMANKGSYVFCIKVEAGRPSVRGLSDDEHKIIKESVKIIKSTL